MNGDKKPETPIKTPIEKSDIDKEFEKENKKLLKQGKMLVRTSSKYAGYEGSTPFVEVDQDWQQMPLDRTTLSIPRENLTRMFPLAYLAGKLSAFEQGSKTGIVMILLFLLLIVNLGLTYFMSSSGSNNVNSLSANISSRINGVDDKVSNQNVLLGVIAEKLNITGNYSIPTVGG
jgi:hypothetical protein